MLAVVMGAPDFYRSTEGLLDKGFSIPVDAESGMEHLPAVVPDAAAAQPAKAVPLQARAPAPQAFHVSSDDTVRVVRDGIWIAIVSLPVAYLAMRLFLGRRRRRYLFR